jgi:hypothetical protein
MSPERTFAIVNQVALVAWLLLLLFPRRHIVTHVIAGGVVPVLLAVAYVALIAANWSSSEGGFSSLAEVAALFSNPWLLVGGWVHYLVFDLLVGRWELLDSQQRAIPHLLVVPCLLLTFLFGPGGWLLYLAVRTMWASRPGTAASSRR